MARAYRQTVLLASAMVPELGGLLGRHASNHAGKVRVRGVAQLGAAAALAVPHRQLFQRVAVVPGGSGGSPLAAADEARFAYLTGTVLATLRRTKQRRTLIFIPSYYDFVRVRNWLTVEGFAFAAIHEYSRTSGKEGAPRGGGGG